MAAERGGYGWVAEIAGAVGLNSSSRSFFAAFEAFQPLKKDGTNAARGGEQVHRFLFNLGGFGGVAIVEIGQRERVEEVGTLAAV